MVLVCGALGVSAFGWRGAAVSLLCFAFVARLTLTGLARYAHPPRFGPGNAITLSRSSLTAWLYGVAGEWLLGGLANLSSGFRWTLVCAALLVLVLDGLDGPAARRSGMASPFGAWFDMEADVLFILVLALLAIATGSVGPWILLCGAMRYLFLLACRLDDRLKAPLPPSARRKAIYVVQAAAPIITLAPVCAPSFAASLCAGAFVLVLYSFGADCLVLLRPSERLAIHPARL